MRKAWVVLIGLWAVQASAGMHDGHHKAADAWGALKDAKGVEHGRVEFWQKGQSVHVTVTASGLSAGMHGMHIHTVGRCDGPDFASAGGHWNPTMKQHGHANPMGAHMGDLPQISIGAGGKGTGMFDFAGSIKDMLDADGASLVIHAAPDDDKTDPTGNSGARLLCAVIAAKK